MFLFYARAALGVLLGLAFSPLGLVIVVAMVAAGYGIANERKWGYWLGVAVAALALVPFLLIVMYDGPERLFEMNVLLGLAIPVAQFALLVHPQSREHVRIWFH